MKSLHNGIRDTRTNLQTLEERVKELQRRINAIISLDDSFKGKGAKKIRLFYQECHLPFLLFLEGFIADYLDVLQTMENALQSLEGADDGYNPRVKPGIFMQLSQRYPNLMIKVTSEIKEGVQAIGKHDFILKGGKLID